MIFSNRRIRRRVLLALSAFFVVATAVRLLQASSFSASDVAAQEPMDLDSRTERAEEKSISPQGFPQIGPKNDENEEESPGPETLRSLPMEDPLSPREEMLTFLRLESVEMEKTEAAVDVFAAEKRMNDQASRLTAADRAELVNRVLSPGVPGAQRFVALSLLTRDASRSMPQLEVIAVTPLAKSLESVEHMSRDELLRKQALALRLGALESISRVAVKDTKARETLSRIAESAQESVINEAASFSAAAAAAGNFYFSHISEQLSDGGEE